MMCNVDKKTHRARFQKTAGRPSGKHPMVSRISQILSAGKNRFTEKNRVREWHHIASQRLLNSGWSSFSCLINVGAVICFHRIHGTAIFIYLIDCLMISSLENMRVPWIHHGTMTANQGWVFLKSDKYLWTPKPSKLKVSGPKNMGYYP